MDQWKTKLELHQHHHVPNSHSEQREMNEVEVKDSSDARKLQKADREKHRRDKLNEQFIELGNVLDPHRPKNDKASIIIDTIQVLKDLTTEVNRLRAECTALSEESYELTQEKNELREEKSSLKSDIQNLDAQYQQRMRVMFPWSAIDPSSVVMPPSYSFPVPMHPFPLFTNYNSPGVIPTSSPPFVPIYAHNSYGLNKQESGSGRFRGSNDEKGDNCSDVATELELKTPGSRLGQEDKKGKQAERKEKSVADGVGVCSSSRYSSNSEVNNNGSIE